MGQTNRTQSPPVKSVLTTVPDVQSVWLTAARHCPGSCEGVICQAAVSILCELGGLPTPQKKIRLHICLSEGHHGCCR